MASAMVSSSLLAALDKDGDGKVSASELRRCVAATLGHDDDVLNISEEEVLTAADADGDGLLGPGDISALLAGAGAGEDEERQRCLREAFAMYADQGSRRITPASLGRMLGKLTLVHREKESLGLEDCRAMICRFDLDGDGVLSFHEFAVMMMMA